ncbi:MAG: type II CRISPR RNA-guided endonuclease Cas9 [Bacteroidetes bacterium]|nr:type II CRISPR RNA-guided endonuclease Cas9 [Bacteroidota bacterium]
MKKILGLDLGVSSIGWALIDEKENKIIGMGSRIIPMGTDKLDYEKGIGITKNADRRIARTIRKMNKRYKLRRNKLLFILNELGMLPDQFRFKNGIPEATRLQKLELLPIKKGTLQLDSKQHYELRVKALEDPFQIKEGDRVTLKELGKILYQFNQLRGYAGGNNEDEKNEKKKTKEDEEETEKKKYEVITQRVPILKVVKSERTFKVKGGANKGQELFYYDVTILFNDEEKEGSTILQNLETGKEEELEIRIKQTKKGENIILALPQKTNWRKDMEATETILKKENLFIGQLILKDLIEKSKWTRIRNRVFLRYQYQKEFDAIWDQQAKYYTILNNCPKEKLETIVNYLYPGTKQSQIELRKDGLEKGLKHIIRNQVIYYQRPLKQQTELISKCKFEKDESVLAVSHPLFQEFRCWDQINRMYLTSKVETFDSKKDKTFYKYYNKYLSAEQKNEIYKKLISKKQVVFADIAKIVELKNDRTEYLNGLNPKAKLKGCDTVISIRKILDEQYDKIIESDSQIIAKIWYALFNNTGNEYDEASPKVSALINVLQNVVEKPMATDLALKLAQNIRYPRKYSNLSAKAINKILALMICNPVKIDPLIKEKYEKIKHTIETGEINDNDNIEPYMIDYIYNNSTILETGGMMFAFAASLIYGKHTTDNLKPTITDYHKIQYTPDRNFRNPVVEQIVNETMQIIKALWKQYNIDPKDLEIRVELARELKNSAEEREKIYRAQRNNQTLNESIKRRLAELKQDANNENVERYKIWSRQNIEELPKLSKEPTYEEIEKMRIWEEQKCISPYTLKPIPLSKLFTREYDIDHIIPKSRLFDDSYTNKVVCESNINEEKSNLTAWEYITRQATKFQICSIDAYLKNVNDNYFGKKKRNLLLEKIPSNLVERQIKETQYISVAVKNELAKIVGSNNVKSTTGEVTSFLRSRWGLKKLFMELTEERFKQMELWDSSKQWVKKYYDKENEKHTYEIENWSKRYDHRHHAIDALVVALTEQSQIQRLNNLNKELQDWLTNHKEEIKLEINEGESVLEAFFNLEEKRRIEIQESIESFRKFDTPFDDLVKQAKEFLETMIVSHKSKDSLSIQYSEKTKKKELKIRGQLHEATLYGKHNGKDTKTVSISNLSGKDIEKIVDKYVLKKKIEAHRKKYDSMKEAFSGEGLKSFNDERIATKKPPVYKVKIYYNTKDVKESSLQRLYDDNDKLSVKTGGNYFFLVMQKDGKKGIERVFDIISLFDAAQIAKDEWKNKNANFKQVIYNYYLDKNNAEKVLFTLQQNELVYLPLDADDPVLNISTNEEFEEWKSMKGNKISFSKNIYKVVKFTGKDCYFIPHSYANTISVAKVLTEEQKVILKKKYGDKKIPKKELYFEEFGTYGTSAKTEVNEAFVKSLLSNNKGPRKIQDTCIKLKIDWLGNIKPVV